MREIPLTNGGVAIVGDEDFASLAVHQWYRTSRGYARRTRDDRTREKRRAVLMHREIAGARDGEFVDHRDGHGLHNVRNNIRVCTRTQNQANTAGQYNRRSRYKGVTRDPRERPRPFFARIQVDGKQRRLGSFASEEDAARRYDEEAIREFGPFAVVNFPATASETVYNGVT